MKSTDPKMKEYLYDFSGENTLVCPPGVDLLPLLKQEITKLDAGGKSIICTDKYFYVTNNQVALENDIVDLVKQSGVKLFIICTPKNNVTSESSIAAKLQANGVSICKKVANHPALFHDRYWICPETNKGISTGSSVNIPSDQVCSIYEMPQKDVSEILAICVSEGVWSAT